MTQTTGQFAQKTETKRKNPFSCKPGKDFSETPNSPFAQVLHLQRSIGNRAVNRLIKSGAIQAKLKIGQPNDIYEQEADRVAEKVMRMPECSLAPAPASSPNTKRQEEIRTKSFIQKQPDEEEELKTKALVEQITPLVQRQAVEEEEEIQTKSGSTTNPPITSALKSGVDSLRGSGKPLSKSERVFFEPRFGTDFGNVKVHSNHNAAILTKLIQAKAFTIGSDIVFGQGQYSPGTLTGRRLLGHELVHVVQQNSHKKQGVIQRKPKETYMGTFNDKVYEDYVFGDRKYGVKIVLEFHPGNKVNAKKIGMTQAVKITLGGTPMPDDPTRRNRAVKSGTAKGFFIDQYSNYRNPLFAAGPSSATDTLASTPTQSKHGHHYIRFGDSKGNKPKKEALLKDDPMTLNQTPNSSYIFETTALALEGAQKGTYYGSVKWGWQRDARRDPSKNFKRIPLTLVSKGTPSSNFMEAVKAWNPATVQGTIKTISDPTNVYLSFKTVKFTVPKGTEVTLDDYKWGFANMVWIRSTIVSGKRATQSGLIKITDLEDVGGGKATIDLPLTRKKFTNYPNVWLVSKPANYSTTRIGKLTKNSEVQVIAKGNQWWKITVVNSSNTLHIGKVGWVMKIYLSDSKVK